MGTSFNVIAGNFIGTDITGTVALANARSGIAIFEGTTFNTVGGIAAAARNVISGNTLHGIGISGAGTANNVVAGNHIGIDQVGTGTLPNGNQGIWVHSGAVNNTIGGSTLGAGNTIAFNGSSGVGVDSAQATGNAILGNSIYSNVGLGIDLNADGVTANDDGDGDTGPNKLQNFPVLAAATLIGQTLTLQFAVPSATTNSTYPLRIEFFKADTNAQEGQTFLGFANYAAADATNVKTVSFFAAGAIAAGDKILATATDGAGNTSEFSLGVTLDVKTNPWNNPANRLDVDGSGGPLPVSAIDAVLVINYLNAGLGGPVPVNANLAPPFIDVTGDGAVSPIDAVEVINYLNSNPPLLPAVAASGAGEGEMPQAGAELRKPVEAPAADAIFAWDLWDQPAVRKRRGR